jgi:putative transposase
MRLLGLTVAACINDWSAKRGFGYPKIKVKQDTISFSYQAHPNDVMAQINQGCIEIPRLGYVRMLVHRPLRGQVGTYPRIVYQNRQWYAIFSSTVNTLPLPKTEKFIGIDLGVSPRNAAAVAESEGAGYLIARPTWYRKQIKKKKTAPEKNEQAVPRQRRSSISGVEKSRKSVSTIGAQSFRSTP